MQKMGFLGGSDGKESACSAVDPWVRETPKGVTTHSQYSCLGNPVDREAWRATVPGVAKSRT